TPRLAAALWLRPTLCNAKRNIGIENISKLRYPAVGTARTGFSIKLRWLGEVVGATLGFLNPQAI
ncbi:MAG: hypothetical protein WCA32_24790, partial [Chromatiaceae bacterium]